MILKASKRGGALDLARHLLKAENEHVEVHELRGFAGESLYEAMIETHAVARGTRCHKFLFSISLSPPEFETVPVSAFEEAIERVEARLGLLGQPRAIVFHEKEGRRHAHCVWSRIRLSTMTAVDLPHFKLKLMDLSRELYLEHDWRMPAGMMDRALRSPLNYSMAEWFKARRSGHSPTDIKAAFRQCWEVSDSPRALMSSLEQCGFFLARGDRRTAVAIDVNGGVYGLARWLGIRGRDVNARLELEEMPTVDEARARVRELVSGKTGTLLAEITEDFRAAAAVVERRRHELTQSHRALRKALRDEQATRTAVESLARAKRFRRGILGLWDRVSGAHRITAARNEEERIAADARDRREKDELVAKHLKERQALQLEVQRARRIQVHRMRRLLRDTSGAHAVARPLQRPHNFQRG